MNKTEIKVIDKHKYLRHYIFTWNRLHNLYMAQMWSDKNEIAKGAELKSL